MEKILRKNTITKNKKAYFDYEILDSFEAGIELRWHEVKSIRAWNVNLKWSYVSFVSGEALIKWMHIWVLKNSTSKALIDPLRERKVFLHRKTINMLIWKSKEAWKTVIPLEIYTSWNLLKVKIWLCQWRKKYDKKQLLKERTLEKEANIIMKKLY